ncbi:glycosyltransferase family 2 protein [Nonomuraea sp. KM88]|uniref:glycosyltransferase family 2 protein n=1 Tax=Nonomuraea sp. KM88 TaxID=3457427 RepID=UPI003FCCEE26
MTRMAAVIVSYNSAEVLKDCLSSLPRDLAGVVVADNASRDESVRVAEAAGCRIVQLGRNAGYAAAINAAVATLDLGAIDAVLVLNPDCRLAPGSLPVLARALDRPGCGIAVPKLVNSDGSLQPSLRRAPTVTRALAQAVLGGTLAGRSSRLGELVTAPAAYERPCPAAWATGAAMLVATPLVRAAGPWEESFLLYSEETEYALRAADLGWSLWYEPEAVFEHIGGESDTSPMLAALIAVNRVRLFRNRNGPVRGAAYFAAVLLGEAVRALRGQRTARAALVALVRPARRLRKLPGG